MLARVAEGPGHPAAAGVEVDDGRAGDFRKQSFRSVEKSHRFLVAVAMEQNALRSGTQFEVETGGEFFEQHARGGDGTGSGLLLAAQERRDIVFERREAARLQEKYFAALVGNGHNPSTIFSACARA